MSANDKRPTVGEIKSALDRIEKMIPSGSVAVEAPVFLPSALVSIVCHALRERIDIWTVERPAVGEVDAALQTAEAFILNDGLVYCPHDRLLPAMRVLRAAILAYRNESKDPPPSDPDARTSRERDVNHALAYAENAIDHSENSHAVIPTPALQALADEVKELRRANHAAKVITDSLKDGVGQFVRFQQDVAQLLNPAVDPNEDASTLQAQIIEGIRVLQGKMASDEAITGRAKTLREIANALLPGQRQIVEQAALDLARLEKRLPPLSGVRTIAVHPFLGDGLSCELCGFDPDSCVHLKRFVRFNEATRTMYFDVADNTPEPPFISNFDPATRTMHFDRPDAADVVVPPSEPKFESKILRESQDPSCEHRTVSIRDDVVSGTTSIEFCLNTKCKRIRELPMTMTFKDTRPLTLVPNGPLDPEQR